MVATQQIHYRIFEDKDMQGILTLWELYSGWGGITEQHFYDWFINLPYGKCIIVVAENETGEIVGQVIFTPTPLYIKDKNVIALRLSAPILKADARQSSIRSDAHLAYNMSIFGINLGKEQGYALIYTFPSRGWLTVFKKYIPQLETGLFDGYAIPITTDILNNRPVLQDISVQIITQFDKKFDALWEESLTLFPIQCSVVRTSKWLNWKISGHLILAVKSTEKLLGYMAINKNTGLIVDIFARTLEDLESVMYSCLDAIHYCVDKKMSLPFTELKLMKSPVFNTLIEKGNFNKINFDFAFACFLLDDAIDFDNIRASKWFMMPND